MRALVGAKTDALALPGGSEGAEIGRRHEALATGKGLDRRGDYVVGVARRREDVGGGAAAGHVNMGRSAIALESRAWDGGR